jgi:predicted lipoprotein with Yx(FWY)xxD motif
MRRMTLLVLATSGVLVAGCSSATKSASTPAPTPTIHGQLGTVSTPLGSVLTDSGGKTIYRFAIDTPGHSACLGTCLQYWPAVVAPAAVPKSIEGVSAAIGSIVREDGSRQLTVGGFPVYTYSADKGAGSIAGQGKNLSGGVWWAVSPNGAVNRSSPAATPSSSRVGGGYGGY